MKQNTLRASLSSFTISREKVFDDLEIIPGLVIMMSRAFLIEEQFADPPRIAETLMFDAQFPRKRGMTKAALGFLMGRRRSLII